MTDGTYGTYGTNVLGRTTTKRQTNSQSTRAVIEDEDDDEDENDCAGRCCSKGEPNRERRTVNPSVRQYLRQKLSRTIGSRIFEERLFRLILHYFTAIHEDHPIGDSLGEAHLVSDH